MNTSLLRAADYFTSGSAEADNVYPEGWNHLSGLVLLARQLVWRARPPVSVVGLPASVSEENALQ